MVEHLTFNQVVLGSSPSRLTKQVTEISTLTLGSGTQKDGLGTQWGRKICLERTGQRGTPNHVCDGTWESLY